MQLSTEIISNIAFAIVTASTTMVLALYYGISHSPSPTNTDLAISILIYYLGGIFALTMLMVLARTYTLLLGEHKRLHSEQKNPEKPTKTPQHSPKRADNGPRKTAC